MLAVQLPYFLVYVVEQLQFVEVLQRQAAAVDGAATTGTEPFGLFQQGDEGSLRQADDVVLAAGGLGGPVGGIGQAVLQGGVQHVLVAQFAVAQLAEVAAYASRPVLQVVGRQVTSVQFGLKAFAEGFHLLGGFGLHALQQFAVELHYLGRAHLQSQGFAPFNIFLVEDVAGKAFHFVRHVPTLVVGNALVDVVEQPGQYGRGRGELLDEAVHRQAQYLVVVQLDVQVGAQLQFAGQVAHDGLEEGVDGLHAEAAVVV